MEWTRIGAHEGGSCRTKVGFTAGKEESKYPPAKPEALKTVSRSKRLRGRYRGPAKPLWSDGTACRGAYYRSFRSLPVAPDSEGSQNSTADIGTCLPNPRIRRPASR